MRKYITELIGTFFLVFAIGMTVIGGKGDFAPIAIGGTLMVMIFAGGHVSGAHYNPAVTFAILIRKRINVTDAIGYIVSQVAGAALASLLVGYFLQDKMPAVAVDTVDVVRSLIAELAGTFALTYVILNVATAKGTIGNHFYGLAIGFTVMAMAYVLGPVSGGAFNPAVAFGVCMMKLVAWNDIWLYVVGCFGGAALAALVFILINPDDK